MADESPNTVHIHAEDVAAQVAQISGITSSSSNNTTTSQSQSQSGKLSHRYRGATIQDLDPPAASSCYPSDSVSHALISAFERDYTHLTVVSRENRALLGYLSIPQLRKMLEAGKVTHDNAVAQAMVKFRLKGKVYKIITMDTSLEELEEFFDGVDGAGKQDFAVVTDDRRKFVLGIATRADLEEFARRRPA